MKIEKVLLKQRFADLGDSDAALEMFLHPFDKEYKISNRPAMIIFPGGGYGFTAHHEAEPVAIRFAALGYQCFVVWYSCSPKAHYPQQLLEGAAAVAYVRERAQELCIDPERISVAGFSAGGHLAGMTGTLYKEPVVTEILGIEPRMARPDSMVLCYPVIFSDDPELAWLFSSFLPEGAGEELYSKVSLELAVDEDTPPAFLWSSATDRTVTCEHSLRMALALKKKGVPFELKIYSCLPHGASLSNDQVFETGRVTISKNERVASWPEDCHRWLLEEYARMKKGE